MPIEQRGPIEPRGAVIRPADQPVADRGGGNRTIPLVMPHTGVKQLINGITTGETRPVAAEHAANRLPAP